MDNQNLCCQRFNKPAGLKRRLIRPKEDQQQRESQNVEQGTDRTKDQHEVADEINIPTPGLLHGVFIDIIGRQGDLGKVRQEVVQQNLNRRHRQKRHKQRGERHAEHIAEI